MIYKLSARLFNKLNRIATAILLFTVLLLLTVTSRVALATDDHLILCEATLTPPSDEFIEIANPGSTIVSLDNYYLSDDEDYALLPGAFGAGPKPTIIASDFIAQFPAGATISPGDVIVVAFDGAGFETTFHFKADFEIHGTDTGTPDMIAIDIGSTAGLTNDGENAVLFYWDGAGDLVSDVDMVNLGTPSATNDIGNKTGLAVDGPDSDSIATTYAADAATIPQQLGDPGDGKSTKRIALEGINETTGSGNGITGDDETSEDISVTWDGNSFGTPNPGICAVVEEATAITLNYFRVEGGTGTATITWETGTEIDNAGFNLYRATSLDGPWVKINGALIPANGDPVFGASYQYIDTPGRGTYFYRLEDVDFYGLSTFHNPVDVNLGPTVRRPWFRPWVDWLGFWR